MIESTSLDWVKISLSTPRYIVFGGSGRRAKGGGREGCVGVLRNEAGSGARGEARRRRRPKTRHSTKSHKDEGFARAITLHHLRQGGSFNSHFASLLNDLPSTGYDRLGVSAVWFLKKKQLPAGQMYTVHNVKHNIDNKRREIHLKTDILFWTVCK